MRIIICIFMNLLPLENNYYSRVVTRQHLTRRGFAIEVCRKRCRRGTLPPATGALVTNYKSGCRGMFGLITHSTIDNICQRFRALASRTKILARTWSAYDRSATGTIMTNDYSGFMGMLVFPDGLFCLFLFSSALCLRRR